MQRSVSENATSYNSSSISPLSSDRSSALSSKEFSATFPRDQIDCKKQKFDGQKQLVKSKTSKDKTKNV